MTAPSPPQRIKARARLPVGAPAPDFRLCYTPDQTVSLSTLRGRPVVLIFYPADWSPVCNDQLTMCQEFLPEIRRLGAELIGISVDGVWSHLAFAQHRGLQFLLLADFEPKGRVARSYGVYRPRDGTSERAIFVIDRQGVVRWSYLGPLLINPGVDGFLSALETMETGGPSS
jgi:peroxiredoxin